jgi:hypothetical protein
MSHLLKQDACRAHPRLCELLIKKSGSMTVLEDGTIKPMRNDADDIFCPPKLA